MAFIDKLAGIEYSGVPGISLECQEAVMRILQSRDRIKLARILSSSGTHCFLLTLDHGDLVAIKSGFGSGYGGEGPRRFSYVIQLLEAHGVEIEEYEVGGSLLGRLDQSALTEADLKQLRGLKQVRPQRWHEYIFDKHYEQRLDGTLWQEFFPVMPFGIIDNRITSLAVDFWNDSDSKLMTGYRKLEDLVRKKSGLHTGAAKLMGQAFGGPSPILRWKKIDAGEQAGRTNLFTGAYMAHRNPRAHGEPKERYRARLLDEFLVLNHLFLLEKDAYRPRKSKKAA